MNRRGFLGSVLALAAAPAIVRADSLMRIVPVDAVILPAAESGLTEAALIAAIKKVWEAGGEPDVIRCGEGFARAIDSWFVGAATRFTGGRGAMPCVQSLYVSDYGTSRIEIDRRLSGFVVDSA